MRFALARSLALSATAAIAEFVDPARKDQRETFRSQFEGMPLEPFTYDDHQATLDRLVGALRA